MLDARANFPNPPWPTSTIRLTMPPDLVKAHQALDRAVDAAYGRHDFKSEADRVAFLFELYQHYIDRLPAPRAKRSPDGAQAESGDWNRSHH